MERRMLVGGKEPKGAPGEATLAQQQQAAPSAQPTHSPVEGQIGAAKDAEHHLVGRREGNKGTTSSFQDKNVALLRVRNRLPRSRRNACDLGQEGTRAAHLAIVNEAKRHSILVVPKES